MSSNRHFFEPTDKRARASALRAAGKENARAGFRCFSEVCFEMADLLDPPPPPEPTLRANHRHRPTRSSSHLPQPKQAVYSVNTGSPNAGSNLTRNSHPLRTSHLRRSGGGMSKTATRPVESVLPHVAAGRGHHAPPK
jgi:hypothetical protein